MVSSLVSLPLRLTVGATRTTVGVTRATLRISTKLTLKLASEVLNQMGARTQDAHAPADAQRSAPARSAAPSSPGHSNGAAPEPASGPATATAAPPLADLDTVSPLEEQPDTPLSEAQARAKSIDDEDEVVGEFAERGAEDGAGAQLELSEPWTGYDRADVEAITNEIAGADAAELAIIELYERSKRNRATVLEAAEKRLRALANGR